MEGRKLRGKKWSGFIFFISMFRWKENERKGNRKRIIIYCLFVWKSERKERDNTIKWQFYFDIVIKNISTILINIK